MQQGLIEGGFGSTVTYYSSGDVWITEELSKSHGRVERGTGEACEVEATKVQ